MIKKIIFLSVLTVAISYSTSYSQTTGTGQVQTPQTNPAQFPSYIVKPSEDLNPYGLSSIGESTEKNYRDGSGTLGTTTSNRPSNAEIKKAKEERKKQKQGAKEESVETKETSASKSNTGSSNYRSNSSNTTTSKVGKTQLIKWTDENGVVHISNNMGAIPQKYRKQLESQGFEE